MPTSNDNENQSQIVSLSLTAPDQASVLLRKTGEVKLTTDGGHTWQVVPVAGVGDDIEFAKMIGTNRGWAANRQGQVFRTDSGGLNWTTVTDFKDITGVAQIEFVNGNDGWMREFLSIWRTNDGGLTWRKTLSTVTPGVHGQPSGMFVVDRDKVVASGGDGQVYVTKDGGEHWKISTPVSGNVSLDDVWFVDQTRGWVTGYVVIVAGEKLRPLILETNDAGENWKELPVEADLLPNSICVAGQNWWLAGNKRTVNGQSINMSGVLLHSTDSGKHWSEIKFAADEPVVNEVRFTDNEHGWLVAGNSLYRTEDSGKTWKAVLSLPSAQ